MATEIIMPKAGMDMQEGQILQWLVAEGDSVEEGQVILEIMTDKVSMEVEAEVSGFLLKKIYDEGDTVPVITTIGYIGEAGEEIVETTPAAADPAPQTAPKTAAPAPAVQAPVTTTTDANGKVRATPAARALAKEKGFALENIPGTGPLGRIHKQDVQGYREADALKVSPLAKAIAEDKGIDLTGKTGTGIGGKIMRQDVLDMATPQMAATAQTAAEEAAPNIVPMTPMRKIIAKRMTESFFTAPTFTLHTDIDVRPIKAFVAAIKEDVIEATGFKPSLNDMIVFATSRALMACPIINTSLTPEGDAVIYHQDAHIAIAVATEAGLLTPVIRNVNKKGLSAVVADAKDLATRAKSSKLLPDELSGSTFTISNLGMFGITGFNPIINQPNSAILGVSTIKEVPALEDGQWVNKEMMDISITIDHRVIDGADGAQFLKTLKELMENPYRLML